MKTIAVTGTFPTQKNAILALLCKQLPNAVLLHFDDFANEVKPDSQTDQTDRPPECDCLDLSALRAEIRAVRKRGGCEWLLLDYPFAYRHPGLRKYIDKAIFINTPLDVVLARRILEEAGADAAEIRLDMALYLQHARQALVRLQKLALPSSDYVVDGCGTVHEIAGAILQVIQK